MLFSPFYEESNGGDGYVSIEVSPTLAHDTNNALAQAEQLWARVARPNLMVKIPATKEGIPAIRKTIAAGLNINITLIFSLKRYAEVMEAYLSGLEDRAGRGASHRSHCVGCVVLRLACGYQDRSATPRRFASARQGCDCERKTRLRRISKTFAGRRWENLKVKGARVQRPLWATTSTKNPAYPDTIYLDNLIGPETVNTVPPATLEAFRDHAKVEMTLTRDLDKAQECDRAT